MSLHCRCSFTNRLQVPRFATEYQFLKQVMLQITSQEGPMASIFPPISQNQESSGKHEFVCISMAAIHIHMSTGYWKFHSYE